VVNVPKYVLQKLILTGEVEEPFKDKGIYIQSKIGCYDEALGFCYGGLIEPDELIV
jgi:hypothetical protein